MPEAGGRSFSRSLRGWAVRVVWKKARMAWSFAVGMLAFGGCGGGCQHQVRKSVRVDMVSMRVSVEGQRRWGMGSLGT